MSDLKKYAWKTGVVATVLAAMASWSALDFPRFALVSEVRAASANLNRQLSALTLSVDKLSQFEISTRIMLLNQNWWRNLNELERYEATESSPVIRSLVSNLKREQAAIKSQIKALERQL